MTEQSPSTALEEVVAVACAHRISPNGYLPSLSEPYDNPKPGHWRDGHLIMVETCRIFLRSKERPNFRRAESSYHLKHEVERWRRDLADADVRAVTTHYVTNGAFLVACYLEDLKPRRVRMTPPSPNARVTLPKQSDRVFA